LEITKLKDLFRKYKLLFTCLRFLIVYWVFFLIAKYSSIFYTGLVPKELFSCIVIGCLVFYRFLCVAFIPALMFLWILKLTITKSEHKISPPPKNFSGI